MTAYFQFAKMSRLLGLSIFLLAFCFRTSVCAVVDYRSSWSSLEQTVLSAINRSAHFIEEEYRSSKELSQLSHQCRISLDEFILKLKAFDLNAVKMLDSWGKVSSGILDGKWTDLGAFDECISLTSSQYCLLEAQMPLMPASSTEGFFRGYPQSAFNASSDPLHYLVKYAHFFRYLNITNGLCLPDTCTSTEIHQLVSNMLKNHQTGLKVAVNLCQSNSAPLQLEFKEIISGLLLVTVIVMNILGSLFDKIFLLKEFNFVANVKKLFSATKNRKPYPQLEGLKAMNMLLMLIGHVLFVILYPSFVNTFGILSTAVNPVSMISFMIPFTIDTFFMITGLETMSNFIQTRPDNTKIIFFLLLRWIRFAVPIGLTICINILAFSDASRRLIGGPFWYHFNAANKIPEVCGKNWLWHILLVAHYFNDPSNPNTCLLADWYLSVDFLYAALFLLVLFPYLRAKKTLAVFTAIILIALACCASGFVGKIFRVQSSWIPMNFPREEFIKYLIHIHSKPWTHLGAYFLGVLLAFVLKSPKPFLVGKQTIPVWIIWFTSLFTIFFYEVSINLNLYPISNEAQLMYLMFSKLFWSLGVGWLIYVFHYNLFMPSVRQFLSSKFFRVLARINLSALFVNFLVVRLQNATLKSLSYISLPSIVINLILPEIVLIYLIAFILCVSTEFPTVNIMKALILPPTTASSSPENVKLTHKISEDFNEVKQTNNIT